MKALISKNYSLVRDLSIKFINLPSVFLLSNEMF